LTDNSRIAPDYEGPRTPAVDRLIRVAEALGDKLRERIVFIGGSILPLLQTDHQVFGSPRPTKDVDGVVATQRYSEKAGIEDDLRNRQFRNVMESPAHMDRWRAPDGTTFDLVSCGDHAGGTGNPDDLFAIETAISLNLPPLVRHASAVGFLLLKCRAFHDRGSKVPLISKDLMDIVALVATRPELADELAEAPNRIQLIVREEITRLLANPFAVSAIPSHIADREPFAEDVESNVMLALQAIAKQR
jgi:hypothetical protein